MDDAVVEALKPYGSCDIADALLRLGDETGGFIPDLKPHFPSGSEKVVGRAFTVEWERYGEQRKQEKNYTGHYIDLVPPHGILFSVEPRNALSQAIFGGSMGLTLSKNHVKGAMIHGRIRDMRELQATGLPIFSINSGICASNSVAYPARVNQPIDLHSRGVPIIVSPGDILLGDIDGVVRIPQHLEREVLDLLPRLREQDEKVREAILGGMLAGEAFKLRTV